MLDQLTKFLAVTRLNEAESIPVIRGLFHITLVFNRGAAFGLLRNNPIIPTLIAIFAIAAIIVFFARFSHKAGLPVKVGLSFILAGCSGNLIDRLRLGVVIDFLDFRIWPVFNLADSAICVGVGLLIIYFIAGIRGKG